MDPFYKLTAIEMTGREHARRDIELIVEEPLEIRLNGVPYATIMRTPGFEMELAAGFCLTEGMIDSLAEVLTMGFCAEAENVGNIVNVMTVTAAVTTGRKSQEAAAPRKASGRRLESRSSCGLCGVTMLEDINRVLLPLAEGPRIPIADIVRMQYRMIEEQALQVRTKGAHAVALVRVDGMPVVVREDVGRHNALDKAIGHALLNGIDCSGCVAILSGRISFEMAQKAIRARIPIVAAVSAATALAVDLAERLNCTLIGRLREDSLSVYTHEERLAF